MFLNFSGLRALVSYKPVSYNKTNSVPAWCHLIRYCFHNVSVE